MKKLQRRNVRLMLKLREVIRESLRFLLFDNTCSYCHKKLDREGYICSKCLEKLKKESFLKNKDEFYYLFIYEKAIRQIISDYKLRNRKDLVRDIAFLIKKPIFQLIEREKIDIIIPVPISEEREIERGFNQIEYLLECLDIKYKKIERTKNTKHMYTLKDNEKREKNVEKAFKNSLNLEDKNILIVDDIQEWITATKTQDTFFHVFNHLFRNGKRIILASDRPPVDLKGMNDRLLTRFSCGLIAELEKPNVQLCVDILHNKIKRDGLSTPEDVIKFIAETANGSVRDLQGVINSLLAYSVVYNSNVDMRLAERVIKRAVKIDDEPLTIDDILDKVCTHFSVTTSAVNSRSRKKDIVMARQVSMYMAQKYTKMPASRIGKLVGNRDHSTVIHSCSKIEDRLKVDKGFHAEIASIENSFKLKA